MPVSATPPENSPPPMGVASGWREGTSNPGPRVVLLGPMTEWIFQHLTPSLRRVCSHVYAYPLGSGMGQWSEGGWEARRRGLLERFHADLATLHRASAIDLVLSLHYDDAVRAEDVRRIRDLGVRFAVYHVDMAWQWYRVLRQSRLVDLLAVAHARHLEPFVRRDVPLHLMPMGASPDRSTGTAGGGSAGGGLTGGGLAESEDAGRSALGRSLVFAGSVNDARLGAVAAACRAGVPVRVFGSGWESRLASATSAPRAAPAGVSRSPLSKRLFDLRYLPARLREEDLGIARRLIRTTRGSATPTGLFVGAEHARAGGFVPDHVLPGLFRSAAIVLGVNQREGLPGVRGGLADARLRDFEAPLAGAFYLVQWFPELSTLYQPGVEVETWRTYDELGEKARWYASHPEARTSIALAGQRRAANDHTWDERLRGLLRALGLEPRTQFTHSPLEQELSALTVVANRSATAWDQTWPGCAGLTADSAPEPAP